jgi:hypothetical protein
MLKLRRKLLNFMILWFRVVVTKKARGENATARAGPIFLRSSPRSSFPTIGLPHLRRTTVVEFPHHGVCPDSPIDTTLSIAPRHISPATANTLPASKPRSHPQCIHARERPLSRIPETKTSTATKSTTSNTPARQIPRTLAQRTQTESESREQNLWRTTIRRRQETHGDEEVPQHDVTRRHFLTLVSS